MRVLLASRQAPPTLVAVEERTVRVGPLVMRPVRNDLRVARVRVPVMGEARLQLLGGFELAIGQRPVALPLNSQRLLAYLALGGRPATRSHVAGSLWADLTEERATARLRSALWGIRRHHGWLVAPQGDLLALDPRVAVDVREAFAMARDVADQPAGAAAHQDIDVSAITRLTSAGELLPDWDDDWVLGRRERLRQVRLHALEALSGRLARAGRFGRAVEVALAAVEADPLRESARRALIGVHVAEGNLAEAISQYRIYRSLLLEELGLEPSQQMDELVHALGLP